MRAVASLLIAVVLTGCSSAESGERAERASASATPSLSLVDACPKVQDALSRASVEDSSPGMTADQYGSIGKSVAGVASSSDAEAYTVLRQLEAASEWASENVGADPLHPSVDEWYDAYMAVNQACENAGAPLD